MPPVGILPAHTAPLGISFHAGEGGCSRGNRDEGSFPCSANGDAFVAYHGSWNSDLKVGYSVDQLEFTKTGVYRPTGKSTPIIYEENLRNCGPDDCFRPVNAVFNNKGHLYVSCDATDEIIRVTYDSQDLGNSAAIRVESLGAFFFFHFILTLVR